MGGTDVDPATLEAIAAVSAHAYEEAIVHIEAGTLPTGVQSNFARAVVPSDELNATPVGSVPASM